MQPKLTPEQYAISGGLCCPVCFGISREILDVRFSLHVCLSCGAEWVETYKLTGYRRLRQGNRHKEVSK